MTASHNWEPAPGGCPCRGIRYTVTKSPLIVHCCHCTWCQKESGSAFALNAMVETKSIEIKSTLQPTVIPTPSESGAGQKMYRCPTCQFVVWSEYGDSGDLVRFVRTGTLDDPSRAPPNVHIFTSTKQPWLKLDDSLPIKEEYYKREDVWSKESLERRAEYLKSSMS